MARPSWAVRSPPSRGGVGKVPNREAAIVVWVPRLARYIEECVGTVKAAQLLRAAADGLERGGSLPGET